MNTKKVEKKYIKNLIIIILLFLFISVTILIRFYSKPITIKVLIEEKGYMFSEGSMEPVLCDFKFDGAFNKYLFSNDLNSLSGDIYINDTYYMIGGWHFFNGYGWLNSNSSKESMGVNENYDGFIFNIYIDYNILGKVPWQPNEENKRLIIAPAQNSKEVFWDWKKYTEESYFRLENKNLDPWQLDILNNPDKYFTD